MDKTRPSLGMIALPGQLELCEDLLDTIEHIEVEPQTFWRIAGDRFIVHTPALQRVLSWGKPITLHGVGTPIGGTRLDRRHIEPLQKTIDILQPKWFSEHLSFNIHPTSGRFCGFFLPPVQTEASASIAAKNIQVMRDLLGIDVLFETGVNYLDPDPEQLTDGEFFDRVSELANCDILLDVHNIWCNQRNGRTSVAEVMSAINPSRVREIHIAAGEMHHASGKYLDAHSNVPEPQLVQLLCEDIVPHCHHIDSIVLEITTTNLVANNVSLDSLRAFFNETRDTIAKVQYAEPPVRTFNSTPAITSNAPSPETWELELIDTIEYAGNTTQAEDVYIELIDANRLGAIASNMTLTVRLTGRLLGPEKAKRLFNQYLRQNPPYSTTEAEALAFATFTKQISLPQWFADAIQIDLGRIEASKTLKPHTITTISNPEELFALAAGDPDAQLTMQQGLQYHLTMEP